MSSPTSVDFYVESFAGPTKRSPALASCGQRWVELNKSSRATVKRNWEGLDDSDGSQVGWGNGPSSSGCQGGRCATVWTLPCSQDLPSFAEFKILNMRGRSVFQIGMTRLGQNERSQFWGDVEESKTWYLFIDKYGFVELRDGAASVQSLPREDSENGSGSEKTKNLIQGSVFRVEFDPASGRASFYRNGDWSGAAQVPAEVLGRGEALVFGAQMLGRGDAVELLRCGGLQASSPE